MNRLTKLCGVFALAGMMICGSSEAAKKIIAIMDVENGVRSGAGALVAQEVGPALESAFVNSGMYIVVERERLQSVFRELGMHLSGAIDPNTAIRMGQMSGAELTLFATVTGANVGLADNLLYQTIKAKAQLSYKIVDNKTGQIKVSDVVVGSKSIPNTDYRDDRMLLSSATKEAVERLMVKFAELNPITGSVMAVKDDKIYVNLTNEQGVHVGDLYVIFREGETLCDPAGNIIGVTEDSIGLAKVVEVKPTFCIMETKKVKGRLDKSCKVKRFIKK